MSDQIENKQELTKFTLNLFERITIISLLPTQASLHKGLLIDSIRKDLSATDDEIQTYNIEYFDNGAVIIQNKEAESYFKDLWFPDEKVKIIREAFKKADKEERLIVNQKVFELYNKIVE